MEMIHVNLHLRLEMPESFTRRRINWLYATCSCFFFYIQVAATTDLIWTLTEFVDSSYFDIALSLPFSTPIWTEVLQWAPRSYIGGCCCVCGYSPSIEWTALRNADFQGFNSMCNASRNKG
jgi:hypothetical protein